MNASHKLRTLPQLLQTRVARTPGAAAFAWETRPGHWETASWQAFADQVAALKVGLLQSGLLPGARLAIMAPVSLEWELVHHAALALGATVIGLDAHDSPARLQLMLDLAQVDAVAVASPGVLQALSAARRAHLKALVYWGAAPPDTADWAMARPLSELIQSAPGGPLVSPAEPAPDDLATIIFTSGTTGSPKGIAYSHAQMCLAVESICEAFPFVGPGSHLLCWLPLSNLFQRVVNLAGAHSGALSHLLADPRRVMEVVATVSPDVFVGVPRFYEKLSQGLRQRISEMPRVQRGMLEWAWAVGLATSEGRRPGGRTTAWSRCRWWLADRLVLRRVRALAGTRLRCFISGSAPAPRALLEQMHGLGWTVLEAYGLSENVVPMSMNRLDDYRFGSVGRPVGGQVITCREDGAVQVEGPGVFSGYLGQAPRAEGAFATGDLGRIDSEGFLYLTGRSGELFKTSTGRRVAPAGIEAVLTTCPGVDQALVVGAGRKHLAALLHLLPGWWPDRQAELQAHLRRSLAPLNEHDRPAVFGITAQPFSIERGELTPNLKLRRKAIEASYAEAIDSLFSASASTQKDYQTEQGLHFMRLN